MIWDPAGDIDSLRRRLELVEGIACHRRADLNRKAERLDRELRAGAIMRRTLRRLSVHCDGQMDRDLAAGALRAERAVAERDKAAPVDPLANDPRESLIDRLYAIGGGKSWGYDRDDAAIDADAIIHVLGAG